MNVNEIIIKLAREAGLGTSLTHNGGEPRVWIEGADWHDELTRFAALVRNAALDEAIKIIEEYRFPVGNSAAGELERGWALDALEEIRDELRAMKEQA
jgi:RecB family exonuclease